MPVYQKLLLNTGGGVIYDTHKATQVPNTATILIGLGGTGMDCIKTIKAEVYARLQADDPNAYIPNYEHIRFLGVDADETAKGLQGEHDDERSTKEQMALAETEFFPIEDPAIAKAFKDKIAHKLEGMDWLCADKIPTLTLAGHGAGGYRPLGRYLLMNKSQTFMTRLQTEINKARVGFVGASVCIHVFSGLGGGTGSGTFLDACYMIREVTRGMNNVTVFGYFFLPDVNLAKIPLEQTATREYVQKNGYAAMQELDYCMQLQNNGGAFQQKYQGEKVIDWKDTPVDMCHLLSATNANGDVLADGYHYAMHVAAEYVLDFLTQPIDDTNFGLQAQQNNFHAKVMVGNNQKKNGANLAYCAIGASCAYIPFREIDTYLSSVLFERFSNIGRVTPSANAALQLAINAWAPEAKNQADVYQKLLDNIKTGANTSYEPFWGTWKDVGTANGQFVTHYTDQTASKIGKVTTNAESMQSANNAQSLLNCVRTELRGMIIDINYGPIYASSIINQALNNNLLNLIDGLIAENQARWNQEAGQKRKTEYEAAKTAYERPRLFGQIGSKSSFEEYEFRLRVLSQHDLDLETYAKLKQVLETVKQQLIAVNAGYYARLSKVTVNLMETFAANKSALDSEQALPPSAFAKPMVTISELDDMLIQQVNATNIPGLLSLFMGNLLLADNQDAWINENENKITKIVTKFFEKQAFGNFAGRTIDRFLEEKYGTTTDVALANEIYNNWMIPLTQSAQPLFRFDTHKLGLAGIIKVEKLAYLSYPSTSAPIQTAAAQMQAVDGMWAGKSSALTDRIFVMCSACVFPFASYGYANEYELAYFPESQNYGRHYYEGRGGVRMLFNDWRKLSPITPYQMLCVDGKLKDELPENLKQTLTYGSNLYERAKQNNIIDGDNDICQVDNEEQRALEALISQCKDKIAHVTRPAEVPEAKKLLESLQNLTLSLKKTAYNVNAQGGGNPAYAAAINKDYFMAAPAYWAMVAQNLQAYEDLQARKRTTENELSACIERVGRTANDRTAYFNALFAGVIAKDGVKLSYIVTEFGITTETVLTKFDAEMFPFNAIPIYQGYLTYQTLADEMKQAMARVANAHIEEESAEMKQACQALNDYVTDKRVNAWANTANDFAEGTEIIDFVKKFMADMMNFCDLHDI